jgi:MFS family permease
MPTSRSVLNTYYSLTVLYTLSVSIIWGINTLFLMDAGLDIFQVMLVNAVFTAGMVVFEVPTGVVADTIGRKASFLFCVATLFVTTLLYVMAAHFNWGVYAFMAVSLLIGLGFTFFTGAVEAWLVDALDATGFEGSQDIVFARGQMFFAASVLVGTVSGGALGQLDLSLPYVVRAGLLFPTFFIVLIFMKDLGFKGRALKVATIGQEARKVFVDGVTHGWRNPVIRLCLLVSFVEGLFFIYGWYSWQRYFLDLLARELVWVAGLVSALMSVSMILGNSLVGRLTRSDGANRSRILTFNVALRSTVIMGAGALGVFASPDSRGPWLFGAVVFLYLVFGVSFGLSGPVRMAFINRQIPSERRATVLSLDSLFNESGGMMGQTGLGYISKKFTIGLGWVIGGAAISLAAPLYRRAGLAERKLDVEQMEG